MKKTLAISAIFFFSTTPLLLPLLVQAAGGLPGGGGGGFTAPNIFPTGYWPSPSQPLIVCSGFYAVTGQNNSQAFTPPSGSQPSCTSLCQLIETFVNIVYFGMTIALFILAPISFVIGGIMFMTAAGNPSKIQNAKKVLIGVVIGVAIILFSYLIISVFLGIIGASINFGIINCS